jgi:hypothetical protein
MHSECPYHGPRIVGPPARDTAAGAVRDGRLTSGTPFSYMPGLPGADSFAVYAGDVRTASDLTQARPLECSIPAGRPPIPGEQLTVADTLPNPAAGAGRYYVAAVRHGDQIRAGRSMIGGTLQGRNARALQECQ